MEEIILNRARDVFFMYGLKSISMNDLARESGISKRRIYTFFSDKNELIERLVDSLIEEQRVILSESREKAKDAVDEVLLQSEAAVEFLSKVSPRFFLELQKSVAPMWDRIHYYRNQVLLPAIQENLLTGIRENYYRHDIDPEFVARVRLLQTDAVWQPNELLNKALTPESLMKQLTAFYLHGITSEKGKERLNLYLTNYNA